MQGANYQDNVIRPLSRDHDDNATADIDPEEIDADLDLDTGSSDPGERVLSAVERVCAVLLLVCLYGPLILYLFL